MVKRPRFTYGARKGGSLTPAQRKAVKKMLSNHEEQKHHQVTVNSNVGAGGILNQLNLFAGGVQSSQRVGITVRNDRLKARGYLQSRDTTGASSARVMVVYSKEPLISSDFPLITECDKITGFQSYTILYDRFHRFLPNLSGDKSLVDVNFDIDLKGRLTKWGSNSGSDIVSGGLYLWVVDDEVLSGDFVLCNINFSLYYKE